MELDAVYEALASGAADPGDLSWSRRRLQAMALDRAKHGDVAARLGALRVAASLGPNDGLPVVSELVRDPDRQVRTWAVHQAIGARDRGIAALRAAVDGPDPEQVRLALEHLGQWVDPGAVQAARRALLSRDASVRLAAVRLLGNVGGPSLLQQLTGLSSAGGALSDADPAVRAAADEALERISGSAPKAVRTPWWDEEPPPGARISDPAPGFPREGAPLPPSPAPLPAALPSIPGLVFHAAPALDAAPPAAPPPGGLVFHAAAPLAPAAPAEAPAEPRPAGPAASGEVVFRAAPADPAAPPAWGPDAAPLVPVDKALPAPVGAAAAEPAWDGATAPLPTPLPSETRALAKLLGMVADADRGAVIGALDDPRRRQEFGQLLLGSPPADVALARGLAHAAGALGGPAHVTALRPYLKHADRGVRVAALGALGRIGTPASVPWLTALLGDADLRVEAARALGVLGRRVRPDLVRDALGRLKTEDAAFRSALDEALAGVRA